MVGAHVRLDGVDHVLVAVASSHVAALAADDSCHHALLGRSTPTLLQECWHDLGVDGTAHDPAVRPHGDRTRRRAPRGTAARAPGPAAVRLPGPEPPPCSEPVSYTH